MAASNNSSQNTKKRLPRWLKVPLPGLHSYRKVSALLEQKGLHTVCQEANCPNRGECFGAGTATFLIMGDICSRGCTFCNVAKGSPAPPDPAEPLKIAQMVRSLQLKHAVITSVTRDDLNDGGASYFADTIQAIRTLNGDTTIEVLIPDFKGNLASLQIVLAAKPDVLNHNVETVPRLYPRVRPKASFERSLAILKASRDIMPDIMTKSGLMIGLGETEEELYAVINALKAVDCDALTIGQYLAPSSSHYPVQRFYTPEEFARIGEYASNLGFKSVQSGPLVRSSYHADATLGG